MTVAIISTWKSKQARLLLNRSCHVIDFPLNGESRDWLATLQASKDIFRADLKVETGHSLNVMAKLGCQLVCIWNQLKHRFLGFPARASLG